MSEVAGRMAVQVGAQFLEKHHGGTGHPARRRAGRSACGSHHSRRRHRRHERGEDRRSGSGASVVDPGTKRRADALHRRSVRRPDPDAHVQCVQHRERGAEGGSADRRRAHSRRPSAASRDGGDGQNDEEGRRHRRRGRRPGRHDRDDRPRDDAQRIPSTRSTACCITPSRTCRAPCRAHRRSR